MRRLTVWLMLVANLILSAGISAQVNQKKPLDILLTNNDGFDAPSIKAMWQALKKAS